MLIASRSRPLDISESAPFRSTSTFRSEPVRVSAAAKPLASASMPMNTATTSPMPSAVSAVETGRCAHAAQVVGERDLHSTFRSAATTGSRAACTAGTMPLASISSSAMTAPTAQRLPV